MTPYTYDYPRPAVTVDILVFSKAQEKVLLIRRKHDPFQGRWAIPGGFVDIDEPLETAGRRELKEETGLTVETLTQLQTFGTPGRDPRGRTISVIYYTFVDESEVRPQAGDDAAEVQWHRLTELPPLAFDHTEIIEFARSRTLQQAMRQN